MKGNAEPNVWPASKGQSMSRLRRVCAALTVLYLSSFSWPQETSCQEIAALSKMVRATSVETLSEARTHAGSGYRSDLVFAYRSFQLKRDAMHAQHLLVLIPKNDFQRTIVMTLGDSLCDGEPATEMELLSGVNEGFPRELANAVLLAPTYLRTYVAYGTEIVSDPHSDYAIQMQKVCSKVHRDFLGAVEQLPKPDQRAFRLHVMNPNTCRAIALPEAD